MLTMQYDSSLQTFFFSCHENEPQLKNFCLNAYRTGRPRDDHFVDYLLGTTSKDGINL